MTAAAGEPVRLLVVGAGSRGTWYSWWAKIHPERARVVAVAEPDPALRRRFLGLWPDLAPDHVVGDWRELAGRPRVADAAIIATPDREHVGPAELLAAQGYHLLLEKPMAPDDDGCARVVAAVRRAGVLLGVCHVLRYTAYTRALKALVDAGRIGTIMSVQHLEPVGWWHAAHSYVRGRWRREDESAPMLLAKSCHDLDWLCHLVGRPVRAVASFGSRGHFRSDARPAGAADRCLDCGIEAACPYSARRLYLGMLERGWTLWPVDTVVPEPTVETVTAALRDGPFGRCVYACDNDVVDHQVVALEFEGGATATFTMVAFSEHAPRRTTVFGTHGQVAGDGRHLHVLDFVSGRTETIDTAPELPTTPVGTGHAEADVALMDAFVSAVATGDASLLRTGPEETLATHRVVFAAERARHERRVVELAPRVQQPACAPPRAIPPY